MDWKHFNVHYLTVGGSKGKTCITALSKDDAKTAFENHCKNEAADQLYYPFEATVKKVIGPLGMTPATPKQKLAQKYGFIIGGIKGAKTQFYQAVADMVPVGQNKLPEKLQRCGNLVEMQFAKLERDIRDCFKLAGLKVK
jgi:hypothetical protein